MQNIPNVLIFYRMKKEIIRKVFQKPTPGVQRDHFPVRILLVVSAFAKIEIMNTMSCLQNWQTGSVAPQKSGIMDFLHVSDWKEGDRNRFLFRVLVGLFASYPSTVKETHISLLLWLLKKTMVVGQFVPFGKSWDEKPTTKRAKREIHPLCLFWRDPPPFATKRFLFFLLSPSPQRPFKSTSMREKARH